MTPEQAEMALGYLAILPDILDALRFQFAAVAALTGVVVSGFIALMMKH